MTQNEQRQIDDLRREIAWLRKMVSMLLDRHGIHTEQQEDMLCDDIFEAASHGDIRALKGADPAKLAAYINRKRGASALTQN